MKNELFHIGPFTVYGYGLMIALAIFSVYVTGEFRGRKRGMDDNDQIFWLILWCALGGLAGAKILFLITEFRYVISDPLFYLMNFADGFVVFGGILGGILTGWVVCRIRKLDFWAYLDLFMPSVALAQAIGRVGCLLAGCCYGVETSCPFSITFHESEFAPNGVPLVPTQIISSVLDLLNFLVLLYIARHQKRKGQVAACYLIFYSAGRFILEFFRVDLERGTLGVLSTSQFISLFALAAGVILLLWKGPGVSSRAEDKNLGA